MRGRQVLMQTLVNHGVDRMFGNPGTTESPLLDSLLDYPQIEYVVRVMGKARARHYLRHVTDFALVPRPEMFGL